MRKSKSLILSMILSFFMMLQTVNALAAPATTTITPNTAAPTAVTPAATEDVLIAAINDFHGNVLQEGKNPGIAIIAGELNKLRATYKNVTFVSSGDSFQGTAISNLTKGAVVIDSFRQMGLAASAIGNHEYDWGYNLMHTWSQDGNFPFLASNIVYNSNGQPVDYAKPYNVMTYTLSNGKQVKVGYIGLATPETATKTMVENVKDITFTDPVASANKWAEYLRTQENVDAVVVLSHLGGFQDSKTKEITGEVADFANNVKGVDLIFSAHTHQGIDGTINGIQILQGYYNGRDISEGILKFDLATGKLVAVDRNLNYLTPKIASITPDPEVAKIVDSYKQTLAPILNEVLGNNPTELTHDTNTQIVTPLGEWSAKELAKLGNTQIGYVNGGGIRNPLDAGEITMGELYSIFPFDNTLVTMEITGADLKNIIQHGITADGMRPGQYYGLNVYYNPDTKMINGMTLLDGTPIEDAKTYTLSTIDFLYGGGDKYDFKNATKVVDTFKPIRDLLA